jgi:NAD(P)-dependent dehydrogenase (short-subunit alcohol dehydrogenase family)
VRHPRRIISITRILVDRRSCLQQLCYLSGSKRRKALVSAIISLAGANGSYDLASFNPNARPELIPVGRLGAPDEVAEVAVMLARNGYITGQTINVNGGWYMS